MAMVCEALGKSTVLKWCTQGHVGVHRRVRSAQCLECKKKYYRDHKEACSAANKARYEFMKNDPAYKAHRAAYAKAYRESNRQGISRKAWVAYNSYPEIREKLRLRREKNKEKARAYFRKRLYGLSEEEFNRLLAGQNGRCAICFIESNRLNVDHDHRTGRVRGLLCSGCNVGIGHLRENTDILMAAMNYLDAARCP